MASGRQQRQERRPGGDGVDESSTRPVPSRDLQLSATRAVSSQAISARELTRRLVARAVLKSDGPDSAALAAQVACERTYRDLARFLGQNGAQALLTRAVAVAVVEHPVLKEIRIGRRSEPSADGVRGLVQVHGVSAIAAGLEALLETLLGLLGRLIGDDMAAQLVEQNATNETQDNMDVKR
jgi:hypothetical protein